MDQDIAQNPAEKSAVAARTRPQSGAVRSLVFFAVISFIIGLVATLWAVLHSQSVRQFLFPDTLPPPHANSKPVPSRGQLPSPVTIDADARLSVIERRLVQAEALSASVYADAARAERLLILAASRRAVDRGVPLGGLEAALQRQFGSAHSADVATIIMGARQPVTLNQLIAGLAQEESHFAGVPDDAPWHRIAWQSISALAVLRRENEVSQAPASKLQRARLALGRDNVDVAVRELETLPGSYAAKPWLNKARRYSQTRAALDRLEMATLAEADPSLASKN